MPTRLLPCLLVLLLAACAQTAPDPRLGPTRVAQAQAAFDEAFRDRPFAEGPVSIVAAAPGPIRALQTFQLVPCRDGQSVCGANAHGPVATLGTLDGRLVVAGAYPGVRFHLGPNGSGFVERAGVFEPLAWE